MLRSSWSTWALALFLKDRWPGPKSWLKMSLPRKLCMEKICPHLSAGEAVSQNSLQKKVLQERHDSHDYQITIIFPYVCFNIYIYIYKTTYFQYISSDFSIFCPYPAVLPAYHPRRSRCDLAAPLTRQSSVNLPSISRRKDVADACIVAKCC